MLETGYLEYWTAGYLDTLDHWTPGYSGIRYSWTLGATEE